MRYYVGLKSGVAEVFHSTEPAPHPDEYGVVVGPFETKNGAYFYIENVADYVNAGEILTPQLSDIKAKIQPHNPWGIAAIALVSALAGFMCCLCLTF